ncbi:MAG TPA: CocE/NonD family hydrolase [Mycobacteriales bacterium]|jgi:hypothetical protein
MRRALLAVLSLVAALVAPAVAEPPPLTTWPYRAGYVTMADGTELRYVVFLPSATGSFPTVLEYDGYSAGTNPAAGGPTQLGERMLAKGYAVLGVNTRGSGCSGGDFDPFSDRDAQDGHDVVEWAASQPWSTGDVGMWGISMPAILSLKVAALRPPHLRAISPGAALSDFYRDVAYPGGILNAGFVGAWTGLQKAVSYQDNALVVAEDDGDPRCLAYTAGHQPPDKVVAERVAANPYAEDPFWARSFSDRIGDIDVPVLSLSAWQDEQVSARVTGAYQALDPATSWHVVTNGNHGVSASAADFLDLQERFFDRFVAGVANGFETTPHVQVWHELQAPSYVPRWVTPHAAWPTPAATTYHLTADGRLTPAAPVAAGSATYAYPLPAGNAASAGYDTEIVAWHVPGYGVSFTTDAFAAPVELFGPASADLWVSSTATDTDLQVTLTEVRADGSETYVQRGWLRASHRALDASSTALRPVHPHTRASVAPLVAGTPTPVRVEVFAAGHVFRAGSRLRLSVEAPASATGMRAFTLIPTPALNTVHTGGLTPSRLVVGTIPATGVVAAYPECDTLVNQPCR